MHHHEVSEETSGGGDLAHLTVGVGQQATRHQMLGLLPGFTGHHVHFRLFVGQGQSRVDVSSHADDEHEDVGEGEWDLENDECDERPDFGHVGGEQVDDGLLEVIEDLAALLHSVDNGGEVVVEQDHVSCVFGHVRPADAHRNADVTLFDCRGIVDSVAGYTHYVSYFLAGLDDLQFLGWSGSGEDDLRFLDPGL